MPEAINTDDEKILAVKGKIMALATIGAVVALSIVAASLWVPQGPITFDEERYRLGESIFMKSLNLLLFWEQLKICTLQPHNHTDARL